MDREQILSERELALLEKIRVINAASDEQLNRERPPAAVHFIAQNEVGERFCHYGVRGLLNQYLKTGLGYRNSAAKAQVHLFNAVAHASASAGAALADSVLGKYRTVAYLSPMFLLGSSLLALCSVNGLLGGYAYIVPALLAAGSGAIRPCLATHGGDQFYPTQPTLMDRYLSRTSVAVSIGALFSQCLAPLLKDNVQCFGSQCYVLAFGLSAAVFATTSAVFLLGSRLYRIAPVKGRYLPWTAVKLASLALLRWARASPSRRQAVGPWLKFAESEYGPELVEETRLLAKVAVMFTPLAFFWMLYDQSGTEWQNQYEKMDKHLLGFVPVPTEAVSAVNTLLVLILVPILKNHVYPSLERRRIGISLLARMAWGFFFVVLAFVVSTSLEYFVNRFAAAIVYRHNAVVSCEGCASGAWQLPQWFLLSLGESVLATSWLPFAEEQVGPQMRSAVPPLAMVTASLGNLLVILLAMLLRGVGVATRQWAYVALASLGLLVFLALSRYWFVSKEDEERAQYMTRIIPEYV